MHNQYAKTACSTGRTRTCIFSVNSRTHYHCATVEADYGTRTRLASLEDWDTTHMPNPHIYYSTLDRTRTRIIHVRSVVPIQLDHKSILYYSILGGARTHIPRFRRPSLIQLSYEDIRAIDRNRTGTSRVTAWHSNQLSYNRHKVGEGGLEPPSSL